ncbi:serine hydrolase, partial [Gemmatimonas sp.]
MQISRCVPVSRMMNVGVALLGVALVSAACGSSGGPVAPTPPATATPATATPPAATSAAGPTPEAIAAAKAYSTSMGGQTFLVLHRGRVLDESYTNGGSADRVQLLASATKGFTGMLGAIAAADGLFDLDEPVAQRAITEWRSDPMKSRITYRHLLTMTSGLRELNDL